MRRAGSGRRSRQFEGKRIRGGGDRDERLVIGRFMFLFPACAATIVAMYREFAPPADLAPYVACVWTTVHRGGVIFPDGCVDLVWHGTRLVVAGPATAAADPSIDVGQPVSGVRFRLGVAGAALGLPAGELADATVPV